MNDDDDEDAESPTQSPPSLGDAVPASPAEHPAQSPSEQVSPHPA